tara:strand:+ start:143 stop:451 length:309 start_codon:yes stop_codon:yes gene_type:complete
MNKTKSSKEYTLTEILPKVSILPKDLGRFQCFLDNKPITDETLKELGFDDKGKLYVNSAILSATYNNNNNLVCVSMQTAAGYITYKTVGSVKLLIEALKGGK